MTPFDPRPGARWLFCPTHPDDELAFAAWARRLARGGVEVWMHWTHRTEIREAEARRAAAAIGLDEDKLRFAPGRDGACCDQIPELLPHFQALMREVRPHAVVCGAFEQGHLDHDATAWLVRHTFDGPVWEAPFYHTYVRPRWQVLNRFSDSSREITRNLNEEERRFKIRLARMYPSQSIGRILVAYEWGHRLTMRPVALYATERAREMRVASWTEPQHPAPLARRVAGSARWRRWTAAMARVEALGLGRIDGCGTSSGSPEGQAADGERP